jgi:hypothetical protein
VHDRLEAQDVFALGVGLQGQVAEVDLEQRQVKAGGLDHGLDAGGAGAVFVGTGLGAKQGAQLGHVQPPTGAVDQAPEDLVHLPTHSK